MPRLKQAMTVAVEIYMPQVENQTHVLYNQVEGTDPAVTERLREVMSCVAAWTDSRGSPASTTENKRRSRWSARTGSRWPPPTISQSSQRRRTRGSVVCTVQGCDCRGAEVHGIPPVFSLHRQTPREEDNNYKGDVGVTVHKCDDIFSFTYIKFVIYLLI